MVPSYPLRPLKRDADGWSRLWHHFAEAGKLSADTIVWEINRTEIDSRYCGVQPHKFGPSEGYSVRAHVVDMMSISHENR